MTSADSGLLGRRVQIAGSASASTDSSVVRYAHELVAVVAALILREGGGLVLNVGKEPRRAGALSDEPALIFDWTSLEAAASCFRSGSCGWTSKGPPLVVVTSEKAVAEIPSERRPLWEELLGGGFVEVEFIQPGARSGAMIRDRQVKLGDILLVLGGGTGVEHLARLYLDRRRPVLPLDLRLGANREDGTGGAWMLAREAKNDVARFFALREQHASTAGARFAALATRDGIVAARQVADKIVQLLKDLEPPAVFYTRVLNPTVAAYQHVEDFFRSVIDPEVRDLGYKRIEVGTDTTAQSFVNVAVFENLHFASAAVVDLTGGRPNCYMELGYALGRDIRVILTAEDGTDIAFDADDIYCHFWKHGLDNGERRRVFREFWQKHIDHNPLVK
jgi:TIR- and PNP-associating SLOG family